MVMQRGTSVWGQAYANEFVTLRLGDKEVCGSADENGYFKLTFPKLKAGGPFELVIEGDDVRDPIKFNNIMIGDVWISSGQSNMYWPMQSSTGGSNEANAANSPNLRLFNVKQINSATPLNEVSNSGGTDWNIATSENKNALLNFSAVSYHFGKSINDETNIPIGLINSAVGGTRIELWTELNTSSRSAGLYNGMIHPLTQLNVKRLHLVSSLLLIAEGLAYKSLFEKQLESKV